MRFIDEAIIRVAGGHGGPGCVSFRRETFAPRGGPDGGDGGAGGQVVFIADTQLSTLQDFRFKRVYQAQAGMHGSGSNKAGRDGEDIEIRIPVGTVIRDVATGEVLVDFTTSGQTWVACKGGRGGKGNAHFVSSTFQAPKFAQPGEPGEEREVKLDLTLLADVGIIGFPNAGKSTLISRISAARPKIADYPFTTLTPNLGVVALGEHESFVVADVPGLIEGAHRGLGLGHKFLKHIERTRVFLHLLDGNVVLEAATADEDREEAMKHAAEILADRYRGIREELRLFSDKLIHKPEIVVINKLDVLESDPHLIESCRVKLRDKIAEIRLDPPESGEPLIISAVTGSGIEDLIRAIQKKFEDAAISKKRAAPLLPDDEGIRK
ncbi:MAG: hypothetical protein A2X94_01175 [Bdellovibrionales bacterium GWB1_55_8]|nr:MAG: hypothetical protein A2X94_01175 [Bdellovibrionales bacterium GWB1_55_8]